MREIKGLTHVNLAIYRAVHPKATINQVKAFLFNMNPTTHPYSDSQISRAKTHLGLVQVNPLTPLTPAKQAYLPINIKKQQMYWNANYPLGMKI